MPSDSSESDEDDDGAEEHNFWVNRKVQSGEIPDAASYNGPWLSSRQRGERGPRKSGTKRRGRQTEARINRDQAFVARAAREGNKNKAAPNKGKGSSKGKKESKGCTTPSSGSKGKGAVAVAITLVTMASQAASSNGERLHGGGCSESFFAVVGYYGCIIIAVMLMLASWYHATRRVRPLSPPTPDKTVGAAASSSGELASAIPDVRHAVGPDSDPPVPALRARAGEVFALASSKTKPRILHTSQRCRNLAKSQAADLVSFAICKTCARGTSGLV